MKPTHKHPDGGLYAFEETQAGKHPETGEWVDGIAYRGEDGKLRWTTKERWAKCFEPLPTEAVVDEGPVTVKDEDDEVVCELHFRVEQAGDVRYMLVTAAGVAKKHRDHHVEMVLLAQADMVCKGLHLRDHDFPDLLGDVNAFHAKFGLEYVGKPRQLPADLHDFRTKFHAEETGEYADEYGKLCHAIIRKDRRDIINSMELQLDALCDAVWVLLGTADLQFGRAAFFEAWRRVAKANMAKVKKKVGEDQGTEASGREEKYDVVKPAGWIAPDHRDLVSDNAIFDEIFAPPPEEIESNTYNDGGYSDTRAI